MGGGNYDRDVYSSSSSSSWGSSSSSSSKASSKLSSSSLDKSMLPNNKILKSNSKNPIIVVLDVTGSNINFAKIVYDKLPMFYGQIEQKKYSDDFEICICAVGDYTCDDYPIQIGTFAKGKDLDTWIEKLVLEGGGGGNEGESYQLMAYYLLKNTEFIKGANPLVFFIGDESPLSSVTKEQANKFDIEYTEVIRTKEIFEQLREKVNENVFILLNKYNGCRFDKDITKNWTDILAPEHVIKIKEEKSIVDLILGIISMTIKANDLNSYTIDMLARGQTTERVESIKSTLSDLEKSLVIVKDFTVDIVTTKNITGSKDKIKSKRI